jgi:hypothetical protein
MAGLPVSISTNSDWSPSLDAKDSPFSLANYNTYKHRLGREEVQVRMFPKITELHATDSDYRTERRLSFPVDGMRLN